MSKNWYPEIDYSKCTNCGDCIYLCQHDVYDELKSPMPVVAFPESCVEGCKYCGVMCPSKAIKYITGDEVIDCEEGHFCISCR